MTLFSKWAGKRAVLGLLLCAALLLGGFLLVRTLDPYDGKILEGVTVGGLDVGGMTKGEARKTLAEALEQRLYSRSFTLSLPEETLVFSPEEVRAKVDLSKAVGAAYGYGRKASQLSPAVSLTPYLTLEEEALRQALERYAAAYDTELTQPVWTLEGALPELSTASHDPQAPTQVLHLTLGTPACHLDVDGVYDAIFRTCAQALTGELSLAPEVTPEALPDAPSLEAISREICRPAVNDSLDISAVAFVPGSYGYGFSLSDAARQIAAARWGQTLTISMDYIRPEILGEEVYFRDVLGHCETPHNSNENRNTNLRLVCQILDGLVLQPGEAFSYNGAVGERTPERGFQPAPAYSGDRMITDYGGGVCQGSSTLYNCVLLADLTVTERVCHGFTVNYLPIGLDAAVNWGTNTDLKFINSSHFPIRLRAQVEGGYMKMQILGTDEKDYYIELRSSRSEDEHRIYSNSYQFKYDKQTGELISKDLAARSAYMHYEK